MQRVTIQDVADRANVSKVTVSYVLNGRGRKERISDVTAKRIYEAAEQLGYRPNALARMLATKRTDCLAVVFQSGVYFSTWSSFTGEVMRGVTSTCVELGFDLMLHTKDLGKDEESTALSDGRVDGVLILRDENDPIAGEMAKAGVPCVMFFTRSDDPSAAFVDCDNYSGGRMATRYLLELGHTRIGMVRGGLGSVSSNDRFNGYRDALEGVGQNVDSDLVVQIPTPTDDFAEFRNLMSSSDRPTAVFVWSDDVAFVVLRELRALGLDVPGDVSVIGFDSLESCDHCTPTLTSVRQPIYEMSQEATRLLVSLIRNESIARRQILFPLSLDLRDSTAPCPSRMK